jgi:hypothetical protein
MATRTPDISAQKQQAFVDGPLPPFPEIVSVLAGLPDQSAPITLSTSADRLLLWANSDNSSKMMWVSEVPGQANPMSPATIANFWPGVSLPPYVLTLRRYWQQVPGAFTLIQADGSFEQTYTVTTGISETDSETLGAELGVSGDGLSAKISASFTHSVTTSLETSVSTTFKAGAPAAGFQRVWVLWQLIDEIVALTPDGSVLTTAVLGEADIEWVAGVPFLGTSGAFLNYQNTRQTFPTSMLMPQQKDFPL